MKTISLTTLALITTIITSCGDEQETSTQTTENKPKAESPVLLKTLLLDLDASKGITLESENKVSSWENQVPNAVAKTFVKQDKGRKVKGSGRPELKQNAIHKQPALVFKQQELVNHNEDAFDMLIQGSGHTWICVMSPYKQRVGLKDVNSFFGNLKNGAKFEGLWGCLKDDNTLWSGERNGISFGRFDVNNTQLLGPKLKPNQYYIIAGRLQPGIGVQETELFVNTIKPVATAQFPINPKANPSKMTIGQERDAIQHPGKESFDGEIARLLIYKGALSDAQLKAIMDSFQKKYGITNN